MTQWKCFVQTHLLFVPIHGLMWISLMTFKHKMMLVHSNVSLVNTTSPYLVMQINSSLTCRELGFIHTELFSNSDSLVLLRNRAVVDPGFSRGGGANCKGEEVCVQKFSM